MKKVFKKASLLTCIMLGGALAPQSANACGGDPYLAGMCVFAGNFAPRGYALAQGQILPINQNQSLYSLLGTTYGGDGRTSFGLPDLRGRVAISSGQGSGLSSYSLGQRGGQEFVTLSVQEIPSHTHIATTTVTGDIDNTAINAGATISLSGIAVRGTSKNPTGNSLATINARRSGHYTDAAPDVPMANEAASITVDVAQTTATATTTVGTAGGVAHENRMPYIAMNWIIVTQGIFPSRN